MQWKKLAAPIVITILLALWLLVQVRVFLWAPGLPLVIKGIGLIIPLGLLGVLLFVLAERIKEIRSGEEDDLDNY